ncbi:MAG: dienelactone hydrolase family protein [Myxococcota bacterium]
MFPLLQLLFACQAPAAPPPDPFWNGHESMLRGEPEGAVCTVVALHGYGADPVDLKNLFTGYPGDLQVLLPRAPDQVHQRGWSWFPRLRDVGRDELASGVNARADALVAALPTAPTQRPILGKPIITGFSQGGMLAFTAAAHHPEAFSASLPLSGFLPDLTPPTAPGIPVHAFHGALDNVIPAADAQASVDLLQKAGWNATVKIYPDTTHSVPAPVRADLYAAIAEACAAR